MLPLAYAPRPDAAARRPHRRWAFVAVVIALAAFAVPFVVSTAPLAVWAGVLVGYLATMTAFVLV